MGSRQQGERGGRAAGPKNFRACRCGEARRPYRPLPQRGARAHRFLRGVPPALRRARRVRRHGARVFRQRPSGVFGASAAVHFNNEQYGFGDRSVRVPILGGCVMFDTISWFGSGAAGSSALDKSKNLADVANPQQALDNLGGASKAELETLQDSVDANGSDVLGLMLSKISAGQLYFNQAKLFGSNFTIPNFPFSICATVRVDSWEGSTQGIQTIFQFGNNGTGALLGSICFSNVINNPTIQLRISKNTDGTLSYSEVSYFFDKDTFLGKEHTIIGVCRELESTPVNFDIYVDGAKVVTSPYKGLTLDSLSGTVNYAVNTYNANYSIQPASAHPMMLRNLYVFNFDVSAEDAPYSIADYVAGRLIPPALKPSQVSLALENYTIARNATTKLVKDASGNSNDATVQGSGTVAGDNDQSIKVFVDEIKTQINQANG